MTPVAISAAARKILGACIGMGTVFLLMTSAEAVDSRVRSACMDDYFAYCSRMTRTARVFAAAWAPTAASCRRRA